MKGLLRRGWSRPLQRSDGRIVAGTQLGSDASIVSTSRGYNNGAWHHVVFTRTLTSGVLRLDVDGVSAGSVTGRRAFVSGRATINFGRIHTGSHLSGSMDEVALYHKVLSGPAVTSHYTTGQ